ncbi:MAG: HNH endonuclease, partial [Elusimicrobia bacterium]|nr:HNH endonuclease [Elusimicrobiota bacterium]
DLREQPDERIRVKLKELAQTEKTVSVDLIRHLVEYDRRRLYKGDGVATLWEYCTKVLGLSEDQAGLRIRVARAVQESPKLKAALETGALSVSAVRRLAPAIKVADAEALLEKAKGQPLREVERVAAEAVVRAAVVQAPDERPSDGVPAPLLPAVPQIAAAPVRTAVSQLVRQRNPDAVQPVSGEDWRVSFIAGGGFVRNLESVKNLLARRFPQARLEDVLGATLELLLEKLDPARRSERRRRKRALRRTPVEVRGIPRPLRDSVLERDGHRCTFETSAGRCPVARYLEIDHIVPVAFGGPTTLENLRTLCRGHHVIVTELTFGEAYIERAIARRRQE